MRSFGERIAMNTPIQGSAADIMKYAMVRVYNKLLSEGLKAKIILQVHDELIIEAPVNESEQVQKILRTEMENVVKLKENFPGTIISLRFYLDSRYIHKKQKGGK